MSEMSEKARAEAKEKVKRLTESKNYPVDASDYGEAPEGFMEPGKKLGNKPISKQGLACGGKVAPRHAGRKSRDAGGPVPMSAAGQPMVANVPLPPQNRFSFTGQQSPFLAAAGMNKGGRAKKAEGGGNWIKGAIKHPGALHKEMGVPEGKKIPAKKLAKAEHSDNPLLAKRARLAETLKKMHKKDGGEAALDLGTRPVGGRTPKASGGSAGKGKMNVNIIIAQKPEHPMGVPPGAAAPVKPPMPMPPPGGAPQGMPAPPPAGPPMPPPGAGPNMPPPSMARASGGKVLPEMEYGAGNGLGRIEKARKYGL